MADKSRRFAALRGLLAAAIAISLSACGGSAAGSSRASEVLQVSAIPDQDPEQLQRLYSDVVAYLEDALGIEVEYVPVSDYTAAVSLFRTGDLDLVWFGGLTGVQARIQTPGARAIAQRDIDANFRSVFIARRDAGIEPIDSVSGLSALSGKRMTFGSESSTSGRLMPEHFLREAGISEDDFSGAPGFSGSHDATIELVEAGTYEVGVLNEQVWIDRTTSGEVDRDKVVEIFRTPPYFDYHWLLHPDVDQRFGDGSSDEIQAALLALDSENPAHATILDLFGANSFIETTDENYAAIEQVADDLGLLAS